MTFRNFIWGRKFCLQTDHKPLVFILSGKNVRSFTPRIACLSSKLLQFDFSAEYIPGCRNGCADFLSRSSDIVEDELDIDEKDQEEFIVAAVDVPQMCAISGNEWRQALASDISLGRVMKFIKDGWPKERNLNFDFKTFLQVADELTIEDGLQRRGDRLVPPHALRADLVKHTHDGHLGATLTKRPLSCIPHLFHL